MKKVKVKKFKLKDNMSILSYTTRNSLQSTLHKITWYSKIIDNFLCNSIIEQFDSSEKLLSIHNATRLIRRQLKLISNRKTKRKK